MIGEMNYDMNYSGKVFQNQLFSGEEEMFASKRCISRLMEMRNPLQVPNPSSVHNPIFPQIKCWHTTAIALEA